MILNWRGDEVAEHVLGATLEATDETTAEAAELARRLHPWHEQTGRLEEQTIAEPAYREEPGVVVGKFGTTRRLGFYGLFLELGTVRDGPQPFLRPAGDQEFPRLPARIRDRL